MHSCELVHQLADEREQGSVANGKGIQSAVVLDGSEIAVFLLDKEERECVRGLGLADIPLFKVLCNKLLQSDVFSQRQGVNLAVHCIRGVWF